MQRVKNKWKITLKDGLISVGGKDYLFGKCSGSVEHSFTLRQCLLATTASMSGDFASPLYFSAHCIYAVISFARLPAIIPHHAKVRLRLRLRLRRERGKKRKFEFLTPRRGEVDGVSSERGARYARGGRAVRVGRGIEKRNSRRRRSAVHAPAAPALSSRDADAPSPLPRGSAPRDDFFPFLHLDHFLHPPRSRRHLPQSSHQETRPTQGIRFETCFRLSAARLSIAVAITPQGSRPAHPAHPSRSTLTLQPCTPRPSARPVATNRPLLVTARQGSHRRRRDA